MRTVTISRTASGDIELSECVGGGFRLEETDDTVCRYRLSRKYDTALAALQDLESGSGQMWDEWADYFGNGDSDQSDAA